MKKRKIERRTMGKIAVLVVLGMFVAIVLSTTTIGHPGTGSWDHGGNGFGGGGATPTLGTTSPDNLAIINNNNVEIFVGSGKVGIGISNPSAAARVTVYDDNYICQIRFQDANVGTGVSDGFLVGMDQFDHGWIWDYEEKDIRIGTNNLERITIKSDGKVGIGIITPAVKLDIDTGSNSDGLRLRGTAETTEIGDIYIGSNGQMVLSTVAGTDDAPYIDVRSKDDLYGLVLRESDGSGTTTYANFYVVATTDDYMNIVMNSDKDTEGLVITDSDRVGIGTASPLSQLTIYGEGGNDATLTWDVDGLDWYMGVDDDDFDKLIIGTGTAVGTNPMIAIREMADNGAHVGIGITDPNHELHVHNTLDHCHIQMTQKDTGTSATDGFKITIDDSENVLLHNYEQTDLEIRTNRFDNAIFIDDSRVNVGIGTSTPNQFAALDISITKALLIPRLTTAEKNAITTPVDGMIIYHQSGETSQFEFYENGNWVTGSGLI